MRNPSSVVESHRASHSTYFSPHLHRRCLLGVFWRSSAWVPEIAQVRAGWCGTTWTAARSRPSGVVWRARRRPRLVRKGHPPTTSGSVHGRRSVRRRPRRPSFSGSRRSQHNTEEGGHEPRPPTRIQTEPRREQEGHDGPMFGSSYLCPESVSRKPAGVSSVVPPTMTSRFVASATSYATRSSEYVTPPRTTTTRRGPTNFWAREPAPRGPGAAAAANLDWPRVRTDCAATLVLSPATLPDDDDDDSGAPPASAAPSEEAAAPDPPRREAPFLPEPCVCDA
mmetsp:Transcript_27437/g.109916  ORF Transcript_27437/g.109916 Transcript_27437/m.109916 type:complete len:281 (+) Transcript_27437:830-1672(+)